ncbi:hypothetical protein NEUTE2DRAFT_125984 [Neurospora tetrasperma FGSC 2509]|nr:hypothetical protein NEUTE2DRAFT_125984 [Neurospora tetrasperma FGSC 2509]
MPFSGAKLSLPSLPRWGPDLTGNSTLFQLNSFFQWNFPPDSSISEHANTADSPAEMGLWKIELVSPTCWWLVSSIYFVWDEPPQRFLGSCAGFWHWLEIEGYRGRALYKWRKSARSFTSSSGNTPSPTLSGGSITGHLGLPAGTRLQVIVVICVVSNKLQSLEGYLQRNVFHHDTIEPSMALGDNVHDLTCALAGLIGIFLNGVSLVRDPWIFGME